MGILNFLAEASIKKLGTTPLYSLFQKDKGWAEMHRNSFEKYLAYRGYVMNDEVFSSLRIAIRVDPKMTYEAFVDTMMG